LAESINGIKIAESARIIGEVELGEASYLAQGAIIRSHQGVRLGNNTWVLENSTVIGTKKQPTLIGSKTVFGHKCVVLGATIGNLCEIGNGSIFMPGSKIGDRCIFGESTIVPELMEIPSDSVVVGRPARIIRKLSKEDFERIKQMRNDDVELSEHNGIRVVRPIKEVEEMGKLHPYKNHYPKVADSAVILDSAEINGDVEIGDNSVISHGVKIIGNSHGPVKIGKNVQILENCVLHLLPDNQLIIEDDVIIGPGSIIHGTMIGKGSIIESGSNVCDYSSIGENCIVKAGSLVKQRSVFQENTVIEGFPGKAVGTLIKLLTRPPWAYK